MRGGQILEDDRRIVSERVTVARLRRESKLAAFLCDRVCRKKLVPNANLLKSGGKHHAGGRRVVCMCKNFELAFSST